MPVDAQINLKLQNILMLLKRCCNHPYLIEYPFVPGTQEFKVMKTLNSTPILITDPAYFKYF